MPCSKICRARVLLTRVSVPTTATASHSRNKPNGFVCASANCGKCFASRSTLLRHELVHNEQRPKKLHMERYNASGSTDHARAFGCSECGKTCTTKGGLSRHKLTHDSSETRPSFPCDECGKTFPNAWNLLCHGSVHTGLRPYSCSFCAKTFRQKESMVKHIAYTHTKEKPHRCALCPAEFVTSGDLRAHSAAVHQRKEERKLFKCEECGKELAGPANLAQHRARKHDEAGTAKKHFCSEPGCSWRFLTARELQSHTRTHSGHKPYACPFCPSTFSTSSVRAIHVRRLHAREMPYECDVVGCGKRFVIRSELTKHSAVHEDPEKRVRYTCSICGQSFLTKPSHQFHMRNIHLNERPHVCGFEGCGFASASAFRLKRHKIRVHDRKINYLARISGIS